jgi:hypothetical protein
MQLFSSSKAPFRGAKRVLAGLFVVGIITGFLLTPLGFETRSSQLRSPAIAAFFIVAGLALPIAGLVLLFRRPKIAGVLAIIDAALFFIVAQLDQLLFFFTVPPPVAVTVGEFILILVGIGYMLYGQRVYLEN